MTNQAEVMAVRIKLTRMAGRGGRRVEIGYRLSEVSYQKSAVSQTEVGGWRHGPYRGLCLYRPLFTGRTVDCVFTGHCLLAGIQNGLWDTDHGRKHKKPIFIEMKNYLIVDDHMLARVGMVTLINERLSATVREASTLPQALELLGRERFDLILLGINIPGGQSSKMIGQIRDRQKDVKILMFSGYDERMHALSFLEKGVNGFLSKVCTTEQFFEALEVVQSSRRFVSSDVQEMIIQELFSTKSLKLKVNKLSKRETEITQLLVQGHASSSVGSILNLKPSTVSTVKRRIFEKLKVNSVVDLVKHFDHLV